MPFVLHFTVQKDWKAYQIRHCVPPGWPRRRSHRPIHSTAASYVPWVGGMFTSLSRRRCRIRITTSMPDTGSSPLFWDVAFVSHRTWDRVRGLSGFRTRPLWHPCYWSLTHCIEVRACVTRQLIKIIKHEQKQTPLSWILFALHFQFFFILEGHPVWELYWYILHFVLFRLRDPEVRYCEVIIFDYFSFSRSQRFY